MTILAILPSAGHIQGMNVNWWGERRTACQIVNVHCDPGPWMQRAVVSLCPVYSRLISTTLCGKKLPHSARTSAARSQPPRSQIHTKPVLCIRPHCGMLSWSADSAPVAWDYWDSRTALQHGVSPAGAHTGPCNHNLQSGFNCSMYMRS